MAWIEGTEERQFVIKATADQVLGYFSNPNAFRDANEDVELIEDLGDNVFKFTLQEKNEKGVKFQGIYEVEYARADDEVKWSSKDGGNMKTEGSVRIVEDRGDSVEVYYKETMSPDLPIPKLMARVFQPIVSREVSKGIGAFLDRSKALLEEK